MPNALPGLGPGAPVLMGHATPSDGGGGGGGVIDLIITDISWSGTPASGDHVVFSATVQNIGTATTPISRTVTDGVLNSTTTATSATAAFTAGDVGKGITGTGIPDATKISSVTNGTTIVMSAAATATGSSRTFTIGTIVDIAFSVDETTATWSDNNITALGAGASRTQTANGGSADVNYWVATGGTHSVTATANTVGRITESDTGNNSRTESIAIEGGAGEPTLPANATVGQPTYSTLGWGNYNNLFINQATATAWVANGWNAVMGSPNGLYGYGGGIRFWGTTAGPGSEFDWQRNFEGGTGQGLANAGMLEVGLGYYFRNNATHASGGDNKAVYIDDPFDTAAWTAVIAEWANVAGFIHDCPGFSAITFDTETNSLSWSTTGYTGNTHTAQQNRDRFYAIGQELGIAMWGACPSLNLYWYNAYPPYGWNERVQVIEDEDQEPGLYDDLQVDLLHGMLDGMRQVNATGRIINNDATFYRLASHYVSGGGVANRVAYQVNNFGARAFYSQRFNQNIWDYIVKGDGHFFITAMTSLSPIDDGGSFYPSNEPSTTTWSTMMADARAYSEGIHKVEYNFEGGWTLLAKYSQSIAIAGAQDAASQTPLSAALPTITSLIADDSANTVTCVCAHVTGIFSIKVYSASSFNAANPEASYLGAAKMTWNENGGSHLTNFDASTITGVYSTPVTAGQWYIVKVTSAKADYRWASVQAVA